MGGSPIKKILNVVSAPARLPIQSLANVGKDVAEKGLQANPLRSITDPARGAAGDTIGAAGDAIGLQSPNGDLGAGGLESPAGIDSSGDAEAKAKLQQTKKRGRASTMLTQGSSRTADASTFSAGRTLIGY